MKADERGWLPHPTDVGWWWASFEGSPPDAVHVEVLDGGDWLVKWPASEDVDHVEQLSDLDPRYRWRPVADVPEPPEVAGR